MACGKNKPSKKQGSMYVKPEKKGGSNRDKVNKQNGSKKRPTKMG